MEEFENFDFNYSEEDDNLEMAISQEIANLKTEVKNDVYFHQDKMQYFKIAEMNVGQQLSLFMRTLMEVLEKENPAMALENHTIQSLILNMADIVEENILKKHYEKGMSGGSCFDDSLKNDKENKGE